MTITQRIMAKTALVIALQVVLAFFAPHWAVSLVIGLMSGQVHIANVNDEVERERGS